MADITFTCPTCDQELEAPEDFAGELVECPGCGAEIEVPTKTPAKRPADEDELVEDADEADEGDDGDHEEEEGVCPECGAEMEPDSVLCLGCGYHTRLRRRIETDLDDN